MLESDTPSKTFLGVRFCLFGFDPVNEHKIRVKLINGGGVGVGQYNQNCTHVIVDKIVYDDPVCVAARNDGKIVVTGLWVDHSFDIGMPVDATSIMYKPLRDLNGIPGAKSLIICLTGYQRQDRDDIMTMVSLMGAQFSKPLVANKVTHLICYKFEGEKYELAKKIKKIKLINHRWLEDCLREWKLLSEANYSKSGFDLEMIEAEAKDSEDEAEETVSKQSGQKSLNRSPNNLKAGMLSSNELPNSAVEVPTLAMPRHSPNTKEILLTPGKSHQGTGFNNINVPELHAFKDAVLGNASFIKLAEPNNRSPNSTKVDNSLASTSKSPSLSDEKFTAISYTRKTPRKSPAKSNLPNLSGEILGNSGVSTQGIKFKDASDNSSSKMQQPEERISSCFVESPRKRDLCHGEDSAGILPRKRELELSTSSSNSQKMSHNAKAGIKGSAVGTEQQEPTSLVGDQLHIKDCSVEGTGYLNIVPNSCASNATAKSLTNDLSSFVTVTAEDRRNNTDETSPKISFRGYRESTMAGKQDMQNENADEKSPQMSFKGLGESTSASGPYIGDSGLGRCVQVVREPGEPPNKKQHVEIPSLDDRKLEMENSHSPATLDLLEGGSDKLETKPLNKKMLAKKTLGSRPKLSNIANRKGSIYSSKIASENDSTICLSGANDKTIHNSASELEASPSTINMEAAKDVVKKVVTDVTGCKAQFVNDETEAPDEEDENDFEKTHEKQKSELVESACKVDTIIEVEHVRQDSKVALHESLTILENGTNGTDPKRAVGSKNSELGESTLKCDGLKRKTSKRTKQLSGKAKMKTVTSESKNDLVGEDTSVGKNVEEKDDEKENFLPHPVGKINSSNESSKVNSLAADKCSPVDPKEIAGKSVEPNKKAVKTNDKFGKVDSNTQIVQKVFNRFETEPVWFILSGHRLQRKEFQQVIRRLKGKVCRDSHQWSYQATHFIAPDIRRTEKLFAAAASGSWILKTDYLSACNQAGKFLAEEPYEWHRNGLSEDGAISLAAPRKWRHLRERTGHGAFYGMRIIVYGECIAPPLDTLKRVVKAGDGTILATSPPYTRFLKSGVDFAVVSPGMPRVDLWVQEFLKHEIPCVVADYLVEFVCKPGYSLERHVLYNTQEWAEKSFTNLTNRAEEIVEDLTTPQRPDDCGSNDVTCQVCDSPERGEVMLICGDESGSVGCGVGIHIDCCDPPLEDVPDDAWFCPKCSRISRNRATPPRKRKKGTSQSKGK
ncbi:BRCT domain-containing protein At4g02110 [Herrania umbratica]|uniref:BRCT domain-containing protein At4g02110 n=1 Tax=Herrania umbratica TaxID=108875 RepID=A0A6J1A1D4_9ROSI|nr:BRCT domain-containing protein At4g02110 [Herrania umbratica]